LKAHDYARTCVRAGLRENPKPVCGFDGKRREASFQENTFTH
jgi:hypothetical protein